MARASLPGSTLCWSVMAGAQIAVPPLTGRVTDQTATFSTDQKAALEQTLQAFETRKGSQLAVLIVPTTAPERIEQYALRVAEQCKPGRKKVDDGATRSRQMTQHLIEHFPASGVHPNELQDKPVVL